MIGDLDQRLRRDDFDLRARPAASAPQAKGRSAHARAHWRRSPPAARRDRGDSNRSQPELAQPR